MKICIAKKHALMKEFAVDETFISEEDLVKLQLRMKTMIYSGLTQGYLTLAEISNHLQDKLANDQTIKVVCAMLKDMGVSVFKDIDEFEKAQIIRHVSMNAHPLEALMRAELLDVFSNIIGCLPSKEAEELRKRFGLEISSLSDICSRIESESRRIRSIMPKNLRLLGNTRGSQKIISTNEPTDAEHQKINKLRIKISKAKERALMKEFGLDENTLTEEDFAKRRVSLKTLIKLGLTRGYLSKVDICENLPSKLIDTEAFDVICTMFNDIGVAVYEDFVELKRSQKISKVNLRSDPLEAAMQAGLQDVVMDIIDGLPMHEAEVQRKRFGFEITTSRTLIGMGNQFEVTRERIRQIESKSLAKIKGPKGDF